MEEDHNSPKTKKKSTPAQRILLLQVPDNFADFLGESGRLRLNAAFRAEDDLGDEAHPVDLSFLSKEGQPHSWDYEVPYESRWARLKKTEAEKRRARQLYTKEYTSRPLIQEKIKARLGKEETQEKRRSYAQREDVKARKRELAQRKRVINRLLKERMPRVYDQLADAAINTTEVTA